MRQLAYVFVLFAVIGSVATGCSTREVLSGAAGAGAGYMIGTSTSDSDDESD